MQEVAAMDEVVITILTGTGRFFSAGADFTAIRSPPADPNSSDTTSTTHDISTMRNHFLRSFVSNNLHITRVFYTHPKLLVCALNGPAVGLSAALIAHADFIYATPSTYILTPFTALGLVAEGGASRAMVRKLGPGLANEALLMGRRIGVEELVRCGFVTKVFGDSDLQGQEGNGDSDKFLNRTLAEVQERLSPHIDAGSLLKMKRLIQMGEMEALERIGVAEVMEGMERFVSGQPLEEFRKLANGEKKHKL
jgi:peroxisomal 3,2-trans-enoyl-CoA isomerase